MDILLRDDSMVGYNTISYYKKLPLMDCTRFVSVELVFGAELF